jgi:site-specific DNA recombinase
MAWVAEALRESHQDERRHQDEAISRLQAEHARLQNQLDAMYVDKLDGRVDAAFFDQKATGWRSDKRSLLREIENHQGDNESYLEDGVELLELEKRAHILFKKQDAREKRRLLDFVVSNCTWMNGELEATYRQPFDLLAATARADRELVAESLETRQRGVSRSPRSPASGATTLKLSRGLGVAAPSLFTSRADRAHRGAGRQRG